MLQKKKSGISAPVVTVRDIYVFETKIYISMGKGEGKMECIFCKIIRGELPANKVFENDEVIAFHDIHPIAPVHVLVIPKKHMTSLLEIELEDCQLIGEMHLIMQEIAKKLEIDQTGFRVLTAIGEDGLQSVKHFHYHLVGGRKLEWIM
ncbi:histidine triad nucleotide-binding protein [Ammoniphilus sp. 3BR4]|uniref:histidine triad nucleotide-binding protein n=1 Tax=Ammoniphilus sp. 3BR4 TaxID=3158265 RepID=UPI003465F89A